MRTVPVFPVSPSRNDADTVIVRSAVSLSSTLMVALPGVQFVTRAVIVVATVPSSRVSSTIVIGNVADVCPAKIVTPAGTCTSAELPEVSVTKTSAATAGLTVTVPCGFGPPSVAEEGALTVSTPVSLSSTITDCWADANDAALAVSTAVRLPSSTVLFPIVSGNCANVCPARIVTVAGTATSAGRVELSDTVKFAAGAGVAVTRPAFTSTPAPSVACGGAISVRKASGP